MSVSRLEFLFLLVFTAAIFFRIRGTFARQLALAFCAAGFFYSNAPDPRSWIVLFGILLSGYGCARVLQNRPSRVLFATYIVLLVTAFAFLKRYDFLKVCIPERSLGLRVEIVGLSYILFRQIHFIVDAMQDQIERPTLWAYLNYQLNPLTLLAGPIQRYQGFQEYWDCPVPLLRDRHDILKAYLRVFVGVIKIVVIAEAALVGYDRFLGQLSGGDVISSGGWRGTAKLVIMLYSQMIYIYMNFSGYCDVVIAGASLVGLQLPENFNRPFLARNILDYWSRWHITLGHWIRDYLFTPFYKAGAECFPRHTQAVAVIGYFVAFSIAGIWHGSTWNFLIYGLLHGAGASAAKIWENLILKYAGRPGLRSYMKSPSARWVAIVATFHYTCFSLLFFTLDVTQSQQIVRNLLKSFAPGY